MREFRPLDAILLASGCKIFLSPVTRIVDWIQKFFLSVIITYVIFHYVRQIGDHGIYKSAVKHATRLLDAAFAAVFLIMMSVKREEMRILIETMGKQIEDRRRESLRQYSIVASLLSWISVIRRFASVILVILFVSRTGSFNFCALVSCYALLINWLFGGIAIYGFFVKAITYVEEEYFDRLENIIVNDFTASIVSLSTEKRAMTHIKADISACFGPIPCMWLVHVFLRASSIMWAEGSMEQMLRSLALAFDVMALVWLIFLCDRSKQLARDRSSRIVLQVLQRGQRDKWRTVTDELDYADQVNFTAWDMFTIRKMVVPVFIGSLANFTVLLTDIVKEISSHRDKFTAVNSTRVHE